mmetsp:Transcript_34407/g.102818  ORF Transcript_34407/g.102818 Transcript_34407/m.102818 type:complete len:273 (+) Transcript_34407:661-1479(+)
MLSAMKGSTASTSFLTSPSTTLMLSPASCIWAVFFRASVSRLNWLSFAAALLMRSVCLMNSSATGFETAESYPLISRFFEAIKVRALLMASCTVATRASDSAIVSVASLRGRISMPLRKGSSTSFTFWIFSSTSSVCFSPSFMYALLNIFCFWPLVAVRTALSFSIAFFVWSISFCRAAFTTGTAVAICDSTELVDALIVFWPLTKAVPSSSRVSSGNSSPSSHWIGLANSSTFSTSPSASFIFSSSSMTSSLPLMSFSPVPAAFSCFASSC